MAQADSQEQPILGKRKPAFCNWADCVTTQVD